MLADALVWSTEYLLAQYQTQEDAGSANWYVTKPFICELLLLRARASAFRLVDLLVSGYADENAKRIYGVAQSFKRADA